MKIEFFFQKGSMENIKIPIKKWLKQLLALILELFSARYTT